MPGCCRATFRRGRLFASFRSIPGRWRLSGLSAGGSVWPDAQKLLLAARGLGQGAAPTTIVVGDRAAVKAVLDLHETIELVCVIPAGCPLGKFGPVTRQPVQETPRWDRWS